LLPFLLVFIVTYAILQKTKVLGNTTENKPRKNLNLGMAVILGLMVVIPHVLQLVPPEKDPITIMNRALPEVSMVIIAVIMALLLIGLFGGEAKWVSSKASGWIAIIAFLIVIWIFAGAANPNIPLGFLDDLSEQTIALIVVILIFGILIWFITRDEEDVRQRQDREGFTEQIAKLFGGRGG